MSFGNKLQHLSLSFNEFKLDISTDSRTIAKGQCFVALVGENFDGFNYLEQVLNTEAKVVVFTSTKEREELLPMLAAFYPDVIFINVIINFI